QDALARTALEQSLRLLVLVERERADARVVTFREERPRASVAEELVGHALWRAEVHLLEAALERIPDRDAQRAPAPEPAPLGRPLEENRLQHVLVDEGEQSSLRVEPAPG